MNVRRRGFTLLEMLLAAMLSATLMLGLWSLFGTYMKLFETGQAKAEQSQLIRGLAEQLADDLRASVPPANSAGANATSSTDRSSLRAGRDAFGSAPESANAADEIAASIRQTAASLATIGLVGTSRALKLEIVQATLDPGSLPRPAQPESERRPLSPVGPVAPELRSVLYVFEEPRDVRPTDRRPPPGLVRRELDSQSASEQAAGTRRKDAGLAGATGETPEHAIGRAIEAFRLTAPDAFEEQVDATTTWIPEIVALEFRYFDGAKWVDAWDSRERRSLPAAVEVAMQIRDASKKHDDDASSQTPRANANVANEVGRSEERTTEPALIGYRDVILLPQSRLLHPTAHASVAHQADLRANRPLDGSRTNGGPRQ